MQTVIQSFQFIIADESFIVYNPSTKTLNQREEQEKIRARFVVELLKTNKANEEDIRLDVELPNCDILDSVGLVLYKNDLPFLVADFLSKESSFKDSKAKIIKKAELLQASYAVLFLAKQKSVFHLKKGCN